MQTKNLLEFGPFRVDVARRVLLRDGQAVSMPAKAFDLLLALLQRPGDIVSKDGLMKALWPDTFVEEGNLTQTVFVLRKALGDSAGQSLIITMPKQGYRFAGVVTDADSRELAINAPEKPPASSVLLSGLRAGLTRTPESTPAFKNFWLLGGALAILAVFIGWMIARYPYRDQPNDSRVVRYTIAPPENTSYRAGRVSPDGRSLALITVDRYGKGQLWVRRLDTLTAQPVASAEYWPFWSADSRFVAFVQDGKLKKIAASGGVPQTICNAALVVGGSWNRAGTIIFSDGDTLSRVPAKGGEAQPLTRLNISRKETTHDFPVFLPDGLHFLYTIHSENRENAGIYVGSLDSPDTRLRLLDDISNAEYAPAWPPENGYLLFVRSGALMAQGFAAGDLRLRGEAFAVVKEIAQNPANLSASFSVSADGVLLVTSTYPGDQVTWFDRTGKRLGTIGKPGLHFYLQLSPDEQTVAFDEIEPERFLSDVWLFSVARGTTSRLTFQGSLRAIWSNDGKRIVYESLNTGLYGKTSASTENEALLLEAMNQPDDFRLPCECSNDGRFLIYSQRDAKTGYDLWMLPLSANPKPVPFLHTKFNEWCGTLSPDRKWIAYASDESGRSEIYVQAFSEEGAGSGRKWQISYNGGQWPKWRRDGKEVLYLGADLRMTAVEVTTGTSFQPGTPQPLFASRIRTPGARFDVTSDGRRFLIPTMVRETDSEPATVIINWLSGTKP
jgi:eukaryotic-like serine/threonine-protein kinase